MTWGYYTPPTPSALGFNWFIGWGNERNKVFADLDAGGLGVGFRVKAYPNKYPYDDKPSVGDSYINYSTATGFTGKSQTNTGLRRIALMYKHDWAKSSKLHHRSIIGLGYMKTQVQSRQANFGTLFFADSTIGIISHGFTLDKFEYFRDQNIYLSLGYELAFDIGKRWSLNARAVYNQGLFRMIRFHTFRSYTESISGYSEFDEQWSVTRLSYFSFQGGVSYKLDLKKKDR